MDLEQTKAGVMEPGRDLFHVAHNWDYKHSDQTKELTMEKLGLADEVSGMGK